jgi:ribosome-associated translation inhibitor RaiA
MNQKIFLSALRFELSPGAAERIERFAQKLFSHATGVARVDVGLEGEYALNTRITYHVTLRAQLRDEVLFEVRQGEQLLPTVEAVIDSLDRRLQEIDRAPSRTTPPLPR